MTQAGAELESHATQPLQVSRHWQARLLRTLRNASWTARIGLLICLLNLLVVALAPVLAPYGESEIVGRQYESWSVQHLLGTDALGRDMFSRLIFGARNTVSIAFATTVLACVIGVTLGLIASVKGGWIDQLISRAVDVLMSIPQLIFGLLLLSIFGSSALSLILIIGVLDSTRIFRLCRAVAMNVAVMDFIEAARLQGESSSRIMASEILPNILGPLVAEFGLRFSAMFLTISAISFLGLGIQPPAANWGSMVRESASLISYGDITPLLPALAITQLAIAVNFVVDLWLQEMGLDARNT
jgi:peptide/nickel transport system permease protein